MQCDLLWSIMIDRHSPQASATASLHLFPYKMHWKNCYCCSPQRSAKWHISRKMLLLSSPLFSHPKYMPPAMAGWHHASLLPHYPLWQTTAHSPAGDIYYKKSKRDGKDSEAVLHPMNHTLLHSKARPWIIQGWKSSKTHSDFWWVCRFCYSSYIPHLYILMAHGDHRRQDTELLFPLDRYPEISLGLKD